jgi:purine-nucleoside phosphorylase
VRVSYDARMNEQSEMARTAAAIVAERTGHDRHDVAVVLGSGWGPAADAIGTGVEVPMADLPGFPPPTVPGHEGGIRSVLVGDLRVLVLRGRVHLYEGHAPTVVAQGVRTAAAAGCRVLVLTNASGSIRPDWEVGSPALVTDHINYTGASPLVGPDFTDLTDLYSARLRAIARLAEPSINEGVYMGFRGPHFETPAEIRMGRILGADLVGMSTVLEAIAGRNCGMEVLAVALVSNLAAGVTDQPLSGEEVFAAAREAAPRLGSLLRRFLEALSIDEGSESGGPR